MRNFNLLELVGAIAFTALIPVMNVLKQQEAKDAAFEGALECAQYLAKVVNEQTDNIAIVNIQSFKEGYYGS